MNRLFTTSFLQGPGGCREEAPSLLLWFSLSWLGEKSGLRFPSVSHMTLTCYIFIFRKASKLCIFSLPSPWFISVSHTHWRQILDPTFNWLVCIEIRVRNLYSFGAVLDNDSLWPLTYHPASHWSSNQKQLCNLWYCLFSALSPELLSFLEVSVCSLLHGTFSFQGWCLSSCTFTYYKFSKVFVLEIMIIIIDYCFVCGSCLLWVENCLASAAYNLPRPRSKLSSRHCKQSGLSDCNMCIFFPVLR